MNVRLDPLSTLIVLVAVVGIFLGVSAALDDSIYDFVHMTPFREQAWKSRITTQSVVQPRQSEGPYMLGSLVVQIGVVGRDREWMLSTLGDPQSLSSSTDPVPAQHWTYQAGPIHLLTNDSNHFRPFPVTLTLKVRGSRCIGYAIQLGDIDRQCLGGDFP